MSYFLIFFQFHNFRISTFFSIFKICQSLHFVLVLVIFLINHLLFRFYFYQINWHSNQAELPRHSICLKIWEIKCYVWKNDTIFTVWQSLTNLISHFLPKGISFVMQQCTIFPILHLPHQSML